MARYNSVNTTGSVSGGNSISTPYSGLLTTLTGSGGVTVPNPVYFTGQTQTFYNSTGSAITLTTPSGVFNGPGVGGNATLSLPAGSIITLASDGTNYISQDWVGGNSVVVNLTATGTVSLTSNTTGNLDNVNIGATTSGTGKFSTLQATSTTTLAGGSASGVFSFTSSQTSNAYNNGAVVVTGGLGVGGNIYTNSQLVVQSGGASITGVVTATSIQNTPIGSTTPNTGAFTTGTFNSTVSLTGNGDLSLSRNDGFDFSITMPTAMVTASKSLYFQQGGGGNLYAIRMNATNVYTSAVLQVGGNLYTNTSDIRLKDIVGPITNAVDKVKAIDTFYYRNNELALSLGLTETRLQLGISAQSALKVIPEVTAPAPINPDYLTVQYERIVPLLIEAIKEQQQEIEELKARLK